MHEAGRFELVSVAEVDGARERKDVQIVSTL
jgi:hypothetical protein